jgi:hypothetical protein
MNQAPHQLSADPTINDVDPSANSDLNAIEEIVQPIREQTKEETPLAKIQREEWLNLPETKRVFKQLEDARTKLLVNLENISYRIQHHELVTGLEKARTLRIVVTNLSNHTEI